MIFWLKGKNETQKMVDDVLKNMLGTFYLLRGNHDHLIDKYIDTAVSSHNVVWIKDMHILKFEKQRMHLCHWPMLTWDRSHYGSYMLHGHCHGNIDERNLTTK